MPLNVRGCFRQSAWSWLLLSICSLLPGYAATPAPAPSYDRDIRPILSENCYACHGPDAEKRKAGLRLDQRAEAFKALKSGAIAIVSGDLGKSELIRRITTTDEDDRMPPVKSGKALTSAQIDTLRRWVESGAKWGGHWAYVKPERPAVPEVKNKSWPRNEVDQFVLARLEKEGLKPAPEADKTKLLRRVSFDLTGLPPTVSEVEDFLYDNSPGAYDKLVDRLLQSPHYGERMGQDWLDLARYADSQGYHHDSHRDLWPWRDWVIRSLNQNMPFDEFTIEQLAGDLLPDPTRDQRIATGFHRNEMTTSEGGAMPEEYAVKYVVGRVDTTARVWLGTSMACAECHDHKYDPISQKDYYRFFAYFNTVAENGLDQQLNPVPRLVLDTPEQRARLEQFTKEIAALEAAHKAILDGPNSEQSAAEQKWAQTLREKAVQPWTVLAPTSVASTNAAALSKLSDGSVVTVSSNPGPDVSEFVVRTPLSDMTGLRLEAKHVADAPDSTAASKTEPGSFFISRVDVEMINPDPEGAVGNEAVKFGHWYSAQFKGASAKEVLEKAFGPESKVDLAASDKDGHPEWREHPDWSERPIELTGENSAFYLFRSVTADALQYARAVVTSTNGYQAWWNGRKVVVRQAGSSGDEQLLLRVQPGENQLLVKVASASTAALSFKWLPDPVRQSEVRFAAAAADYSERGFEVKGTLDDKRDTGWAFAGDSSETAGWHQAVFRSAEPFGFKAGTQLKVRLTIDSAQGTISTNQFRVAVTTSDGLGEFMQLPEPVRAALIPPEEQLTPAQKLVLQHHYRESFVPEVQEMSKLVAERRKEKQKFADSIPVTMVMEEMQQPRDTFLLVRGNFQAHGEKVSPGVPQSIFPMPEEYPANRLGLARWLVHPDNPLVSRVTVNHFWQHYFGNGLVKTAEDFGSQGEWPSHPELLDWLATEFIRTGWDIKRLQRLIVTSATYRQSAAVPAEAMQKDPDNRLLSHFPRLRLDAEAIRDNALAVSGLLNEKVGGPSVYPYQPPGLWEAVAFENTRKYEQSQGADNYRRGLYTYWRRSIPYPSLITFDAPTRETCTIKRPRTSTPLQALTLMNDPVCVELARGFGERILREGGDTTGSRLTFAFRTCLGRTPTPAERTLLEHSYAQYLERYAQDRVAASKLIHTGTSAPPVDADISELAAWTMISTTLLNLDETITKG